MENVKTMGAAMFKEQCLTILDNLDPNGLVITKHGKPVAKLLPIAEKNAGLIGCLKGKIKVKGNIFNTGAKWDAES